MVASRDDGDIIKYNKTWLVPLKMQGLLLVSLLPNLKPTQVASPNNPFPSDISTEKSWDIIRIQSDRMGFSMRMRVAT
jgi:hypothetical protein